jgi:RNA polymerase sigma-70 factor (ECF subfamily)
MPIRDDERELIERCLSEGQDGWDEFVERYSDLVYSSIHHTLRGRGVRLQADEVSDLHNGIFLSFIEKNAHKLRQFDGRCRLTSWVKVVSVNYTIDRLRKQRRVTSLDDTTGSGPSLIETLESPERSATTSLLRQEEVGTLQDVIAKLGKSERELLDLLFFQERPFPEIAERLGTSLGAVYTRKNRLLNKIKSRFEKKLKRENRVSRPSEWDEA